jgi:3-oxoisoapionate decarboxylase
MALRIGPSRIGIAAYSFPWRCGFAGQGTDRVCANPFTVEDLLSMAAGYGLASVEFPLMMLPNLDASSLAMLRARAQALGVTLIADSAVVDVPTLERYIPAAGALGIRTMRVMLSGILEGARTTIEGGWDAHLNEMIARLKYLRPLAERHKVVLAPENHQDATSAELVHVCNEVGGEYIGVTLDAVNPLAVGEEPLAFARLLGKRIVNVHLKDYRIYSTSSGYRLVRCALGEGILDLRGLFAILAEVAPTATCNIELAAIHARHIRIFEDDWWQGFGPRDVREVLPALRFALRHLSPGDEDWRTPWERGSGHEALAAYEEGQMARSVEALKRLAVKQ